MSIVLLITFFTFLLNLPFGYIRKHSRRFSLKWFLCVHVPVPLVIAARLLAHTDYRYVPLFFLAALAGQWYGGRITLNG
ncbi:MAG: hypothetical protein K8I29_00235 [Alphaproteobacteria bacterium]|uniref:Uncharacterized protein n=1 Tax=Candidatus Nitrobium versatile TaxID=2884831 RepID=A0A953JB18_9BACT|nr:hypothetical protein [Candidatus Nitrobium versatile]